MPEENEFGGEGNETPPGESGSALRKYANDQKKLAEQALAELNDLKAQLAKRDAESIFAKLGVPEKVRKFYSGDPTEDAITQWVKENADVFGIEPTGENPTVDPEQQQRAADLGRVAEAAGFGQERASAMSREAMQEARKGLLSQKNPTIDDLNAALAKLNVPDMPFMAPQF